MAVETSDGGDYLALSEHVVAALDDDAAAALPAALALADECRAAEAWLPAARTLTAAAWALRETFDHDQAMVRVEQALTAADAAGSTTQRARALVVRSKIRLELGRTDDARADVSAAQAAGLNDPDLSFAAALISWHTGDVLAARHTLEQLLDQADCPPTIRLKALINLADEILAGQPERAIGLLDQAAELAARVGSQYATVVDHNRGLALAGVGRIAPAMECFERAEAGFATMEGALAEHYLEVAGVLSRLRLFPEAHAAVRKSVDRLATEGGSLLRADALLAQGSIAAADNDPELARACFAQAHALYASQDRLRGQALATVANARLTDRPGPADADIVAVANAGGTLARLGHPTEAATAWLLAADLATARGTSTVAREHWGSAAALALPASHLVMEARAHLALVAGDADEAAAATTAALRLVDDRAALAAAADLRHRLTTARTRYEQLLRRIAGSASPDEQLDSLLRSRPPAVAASGRPADDQGDDDRVVWRQLTNRLDAGDDPPATTAMIRAQLVAVERRLRTAAWAGDETTRRLPGGLAQARHNTGGQLAVIARVDDRAVGYRVRDQEVTRLDAGPWATLLADATAAQRGLARIASVTGGMQDLARQGTRTVLDRLDARLREVLGDPVPSWIMLDRGLEALPLAGLPSCRAIPVRTVPLAVTRSPALPVRAGPTVVASGPGLSFAASEIEVVQRIWSEIGADVHLATTAFDTRRLSASARIVHIAAHARLRFDNAMQSPIQLHDAPLALAELVQSGARPQVLYLSCCSLGAMPADPALVGAMSLLAEQGVDEVVASTIPLSDEDAPTIAGAVHQAVRDGASVADGLATARAVVDPADPGQSRLWAALAGMVVTTALP